MVVLALAVFRLCRLLGWEDFPPVERLRGWVTGEHLSRGQFVDGNHFVYRRPVLKHWLGCAYCLGFWLSCGVYVLWLMCPVVALYGLFPFALSALVGIVARVLDP